MNEPMQPNADRLIEVFDRARARTPGAEREVLLAEMCGDEPGLMAEVRSLLQIHEEVGNFMAEVSSAPAGSLVTEKLGDKIGHYRLLQRIGEGGCGIVYLAEQELPVRRQVAVKIIKLGMDTRQVVARFEAERQAVALMDHPSIAKVFEAGATDAGRPYFVMELVRGVAMTEYCDQANLSTEQRLHLFIQVCHAVQHAHQKGIIHRDIKPSNILVTRQDGVSVPKVIDFGIAKATTEQRLTDKTVFTAIEQFMGTPAYMSPEQAGARALDIDTRSDIYSLGVLLYELLTGKTPFDAEELAAGGLDGMRRTIREKEPLRPSTRLSTISAVDLAAAAGRRQTEPPRLIHRVRGDLDWIVMKCLEKDRARRYDTATGLAADLERHLQNEPVTARPPGVVYRFQKLVRRNRFVVAAGTAVVLTLVGGGLASGWQAVRATRAERTARRDAYFHHITLAQHELGADNLRGALKLLEECPRDLRGWEWDYLMRLGRIEPRILPHTSSVHGISFHPRGQRLAAGYGDGAVRIWDLRTRRILQTFTNHTQYVFSVAFRPPDGRFLASAGGDRTIRVWDTSSGEEVFQRPGPAGEYTGMAGALAFSPDGTRLIAGREGGALSIWAADDGREIKRLSANPEIAITSVACSADGRVLAAGTWGGVLWLWDAQTFELLHRREHLIRIGAVAFPNTNSQWLATASFDRRVRLWNPYHANVLTNWRAHDAIIPGLAVTPNGRRLATCGGEDKAVKLWEPLTGREILKLRGHTLGGECVAFSADGLLLASGDGNGAIRIWDATPLDAAEPLESQPLRHDDEVWTAAFSPDGRLLASAGWDRTVRLWDGRSGSFIAELPHPGIVFRIAFSPDSRLLAVVATSERVPMIFVWDTVTRTNVMKFREERNTPFCVTFDSSGQYLLKEGPERAIKIVNARTGQLAGAIADWNIWCMAFSPDGRQLATASGEGWVKVWAWDPARIGPSQEPLFKVPVRVFGYGEKVAFSRDGRQLVAGGVGNAIKVWDARNGAELPAPPIEHTGDVFSLAFSPNGRWLASAGEDTTVRIWDATSWRLVRTLRGHLGMIGSLAFRPDSRRLASASRDHTVRLWDTGLWDPVSDSPSEGPVAPAVPGAEKF